jgi:hypothetical protein
MTTSLYIARLEGDPAEMESSYHRTYAALAGLPGRGRDWGIPAVILRHVCAFSSDAMWIVDVYENQQVMQDLIFHRENLPAGLRPAVGNMPCLYDSLAERWEKDVRVLRAGKILPSLRTVLSDHGMAVRPDA